MTTTTDRYPREILDDEYEDDGSMVASLEDLEHAVVGHRIVKVEAGDSSEAPTSLRDAYSTLILTLDNGKRVRLVGFGDCCAGAEIEAFLLHPEMVDHTITGVGTTDRYSTWHIFADMGDVLELTVGWSCGNPFYYVYGISVTVEDIPE